MRHRVSVRMLGVLALAVFLLVAGERTVAQTPPKWDDIVAAAKKEGVVVWSFFAVPGRKSGPFVPLMSTVVVKRKR